ncbi:MAG: RidA family protein [Caulobacteraceae bacterium]|nr:RidA family protein [Caulobacteraceae bacterium]
MPAAINFSDRPAHPAYSQAMEVKAPSRTLYISGQVGAGADGVVPPGVGEQARIAVANLNAVLAEAGMSNADLAKLTIYLTDPADLPAFFAGAAGTLPSPPPAITLLIVQGLSDPALKVEIEAIAAA